MTKVSVLSQEPTKELKKIELIGHCTEDGYTVAEGNSKNNKWWQHLVLVQKNFEDGMDLILAYDEEPKGLGLLPFRYRSLMLGHWNDGIV